MRLGVQEPKTWCERSSKGTIKGQDRGTRRVSVLEHKWPQMTMMVMMASNISGDQKMIQTIVRKRRPCKIYWKT